ncbi:MAG: hypothetical protein OEM38_12070 [Gammaproteobacteria bacterium]|nr:hypothetical protein [Gammaproteobacteria bacterium]
MIRFIGLILAVVVGMFVYDNYVVNSDAKTMISNIVKSDKVEEISQSTQDEFKKFKEQRLKEFEEFKTEK